MRSRLRNLSLEPTGLRWLDRSLDPPFLRRLDPHPRPPSLQGGGRKSCPTPVPRRAPRRFRVPAPPSLQGGGPGGWVRAIQGGEPKKTTLSPPSLQGGGPG